MVNRLIGIPVAHLIQTRSLMLHLMATWGELHVGLRLTAWRLTDPAGCLAQCVISERDGRWHLIVRRGASIVIAERCQSEDIALDRANEVWTTMREQGWVEPSH
jgi:hypothetical protein